MSAPFGPDQIRYLAAQALNIVLLGVLVLAPVGAALFYILRQIDVAMATIYVSFPDENSLHTIDSVSAGDALAARGTLWLYEHGLWFGLAAALFAALWLVLAWHFSRPRGPAGLVTHALVWLGGLAALGASIAGAATNGFADGVTDVSVANALLGFAALGLLAYLTVRLLPYAGVVVNRRSMAIAGALRPSRQGNLLRLFTAALIVFGVVVVLEVVVENYAFFWLERVVIYLYAASDVYARLVSSGAGADWVQPFFATLWMALKIMYKIFWLLFVYGVSAGLYGRLYRESERRDSD